MSGQSIKTVLLIQPPAFTNLERSDLSPQLGLGIGYIAAALEQAGYDVKVLDAFIEGWERTTRVPPDQLLVGLPYEEIKDRITTIKPDVVGITSMFTSQRKNMHSVARAAKAVDPSIKVIVGGAHPTAAPESVLLDDNVDFIVLGEGDNSVVPLVRALEVGDDPSALDGVGFRDATGRPFIKKKTLQVEDLNTLPFPARHLMPMDKYFKARMRHGGFFSGRATSMITSRGCQYLCNFCTAFKVFTRKPRMRSIKNITAELDHLIATYGIDEIYFEDDQLIAKQRHTEELLDALAAYNIKWDTPNGISSWLLNERILVKMKRAGCMRINLALESGCQEVLDNIINKPVKLKDVPELVRVIRREGMDLVTFLVVGNISEGRNETLDEVRQSFRFCRKIRSRPHVSYLTAYPGSEVLDVALKNSYLIPGFNWDKLASIRQQLTTPEWTPEHLRQVVEEERLKTHLWIWLMDPAAFLRIVWGYLKSDPLRTPTLGAKKAAGYLAKSLALCRALVARPVSRGASGSVSVSRVQTPTKSRGVPVELASSPISPQDSVPLAVHFGKRSDEKTH